MAATTLFLWFGRSQVGPAYKTALTISGLVCAIAAYHYFRIFQIWEAAYGTKDGLLLATGYAFNDAYRYVDWLLLALHQKEILEEKQRHDHASQV
jgi:hypothetical protein